MRSALIAILVAVTALALLPLRGAAMDTTFAEIPPVPEGYKTAIFAGGCFWCMEAPFDQVDGVVATTSGYTGGPEERPSYEDVAYGRTGHFEAVHVIYDPATVSYAELIETYWRTIDPTQTDGQFADRGKHYRTAIFVADDDERAIAEAAKQELDASGMFDKPIATMILDRQPFWPAEEYHQDYYLKNSGHYNRYKVGSGRAGFIERTWEQE